jgi:hypothetical protein
MNSTPAFSRAPRTSSSVRGYSLLRAEIIKVIQPKDVFDWMMVDDQTNKYWEEHRYKGGAAALIEGAYPIALESLISPFCQIPEVPSQVVSAYYGGDKKTKSAAASRVAKCGITPAQIQAKAIQLVGSGLQILDRMRLNRETGRRILRKEHQQQLATKGVATPCDKAKPEDPTEI